MNMDRPSIKLNGVAYESWDDFYRACDEWGKERERLARAAWPVKLARRLLAGWRKCAVQP